MFTFADLVSRVSTNKARWDTEEWRTILCWWVYFCRKLGWHDDLDLWGYCPHM